MPHTYEAKWRGWLQFSQYSPHFSLFVYGSYVVRMRSGWCHVHSDFRGIHKGIYYRNYSMRSFERGSSASLCTNIYKIYNFFFADIFHASQAIFFSPWFFALDYMNIFAFQLFELTFENDAHIWRWRWEWRRKESAPHAMASHGILVIESVSLLLLLSNKCGLTSIHFRWRCVARFPFLGWDIWVRITFFFFGCGFWWQKMSQWLQHFSETWSGKFHWTPHSHRAALAWRWISPIQLKTC